MFCVTAGTEVMFPLHVATVFDGIGCQNVARPVVSELVAAVMPPHVL
jgi:hypothetical protein